MSDLIQSCDCPSQDWEGINSNTVLASPVGVEDSVLQDKPASLPAGVLGLPPKVAGYLAPLAVGGQLQSLRDKPRHSPRDISPLEPGAEVNIITVD